MSPLGKGEGAASQDRQTKGLHISFRGSWVHAGPQKAFPGLIVCIRPTDVMNVDLTRREFLLHAAALAVVASRRPWAPAFTVRLRLADFPASPTNDFRLGVELGVIEGQHAGSLLGQSIDVVDAGSREAVSAILAAGDDDSCVGLTRLGLPVLNIANRSNALRGARCAPLLFHVAPSDAMLRDALAMSGNVGAAVAWDSSLERFGADTLNRRFEARFRRPMTDDAWAGWVGVKIIWESALRARTAAGGGILDVLRRDATHFDGHKGVPLGFRTWDRQLRQPLYVVSGSKVTQVPDGTPTRTQLDALGGGAEASECHEGRA